MCIHLYLYYVFMHLLFVRLADEKCRHLFMGHQFIFASIVADADDADTHIHTHI
jgi:hypothetical protein